jgi:hypothetical protein
VPSINLYIPEELKARMDPVSGTLNWSSVAQAAFEQALASLRAMEEPTMTAVLERLKASKAEQVDGVVAAGFAAGRGWAEATADYLTLKRVGEYDWSEEDGDDLALLFEQVAKVDPQAFWADHPKDVGHVPRADQLMGAVPPLPPVPPIAAGAPMALASVGAAHRVALRTARRMQAVAARAMHHSPDIARPSPFYVQGFIKGATAVWREVKDAI